MLRLNSDILLSINAYWFDIVDKYISDVVEKIIINGSQYDYDSEALRVEGDYVSLIVDKSDTQNLDGKMLEGVSVGLYNYYLANSIEIEGGYLYNIVLRYGLDSVFERNFTL